MATKDPTVMSTIDSAMANTSISDVVEPVKNGEKNGDVGDAGGLGVVSSGGSGNYAAMPVDRDSIYYSMNHKFRGHCVIFNHRTFDKHTGLGERNGTDKDRDQAHLLFAQLGFKMHVHNNLTVAKIKEIIQDFAFGVDHTECDALVVLFMSHGEENVLYGRDGSFKVEELFSSFEADQCKTLAGKPKIFFLQACRGDNLDAGTTLIRSKDATDASPLAYKLPNSADFLLCYSTVPGYFSWRNTTNGSWFIQSLVHIFQEKGRHEHVLDMMTMINLHMVVNFESNCPSQQHMHGKKQIAQITHTLTRKIFLTPKH